MSMALVLITAAIAATIAIIQPYQAVARKNARIHSRLMAVNRDQNKRVRRT